MGFRGTCRIAVSGQPGLSFFSRCIMGWVTHLVPDLATTRRVLLGTAAVAMWYVWQERAIDAGAVATMQPVAPRPATGPSAPQHISHPQGWPWGSQQGEDRIVFDEFFHDAAKGSVVNGVFVEIGALDWVLFSNTIAFEQRLGWHGVLIEGCPGHWAQLDRNRKSAFTKTVHMAVCDAPNGTVQYTSQCSAGSGVPGDTGDKVTKGGRTGATVPVPCAGMGAMLKQHGIDHIDFFSIDVEGYELKLLQTMDWDIPVDVMVVEIEHQPYEVIRAIRKLLADHGYVSRGLCCGAYADEIFQNLHYPHDRFPRKYVAPAGYRPFDASRGQFRLKPCSSVPPAMKQRLDHREKTEQTGQGYATYVNEIATDCPKDKAKPKAFGPY